MSSEDVLYLMQTQRLKAYENVEVGAEALCDAIHEDFPNSQDVIYDIHNNLLMFKEVLSDDEQAEVHVEDSVKVIDRNRKVVPRRYTTQSLQAGLYIYKLVQMLMLLRKLYKRLVTRCTQISLL